MLTASASLVCFNMFFDDGVRVSQHGVGQSSPGLVIENLTEDLYNHTIANDNLWKKIALPTPPYSPDQSWKRQVLPAPHPTQNSLQVVPDDLAADELSSDLPLVLSDAEMERLTTSTIGGNDCMWNVGEFDQSLESQHLHVSRASLAARDTEGRVQLKAMPLPTVEPLKDLQPSFGTGLTSRDAPLGNQLTARWTPYPVRSYNPQILHEEFAFRHAETAGKRPRKLRRPSRNSPQRQDSVENDDPEENETSRATHNVLERQRREDLKIRFQVLRDSIPEIVDNERAPKVMILKKARECVLQLNREEGRLMADKELERQRRLILLERLNMLQQSIQNYQMFGITAE